MSDAVSIDPALLTPELAVISRKTKKSDDEKAILLPLKQRTLSVGAKTALTTMAKEFIFGYHKVVDTKHMQKGLMCEAEAIKMLCHLDFANYEKNTERRNSSLLTGECDIYVPGVMTKDTKVPWDISTFPVTVEDAHDSGYEWQGRAYMHLWDVQQHDLEYLLLDTPEELIRWEQIELHRVSHIPPALRRTTVTYMRDADLEQKMVMKLTMAQRYLENLVDRILETHGQPITRKPSMTDIAPDPAPQAAPAPTTAMQSVPVANEAIAAAAVSSPAVADALIAEAVAGIVTAGQHPADDVIDVVLPLSTVASTPPTLKLGEIGQRLGFTVTSEFLASLGFAHSKGDKQPGKLYHEADFPRICAALRRHIDAVQAQF